MNTMSMKCPFPATAPTSGQTINLLSLTGKVASDARRLIISITSSADSAASGVVFSGLFDNQTVTYRTWTSYTYLTVNGLMVYDVAIPLGVSAIKVTYANSAAVLTTWEGSIGISYDERAAA